MSVVFQETLAAIQKKGKAVTYRPRILAVDDQDDILDLIRMTLEAQYDVATLNSPVDLFEVMEVVEPDLLILDVMMPRVTGFQLTELLRKGAQTKEIPIIILSAKSTAGDIKHGYKVGATLYLTKPFQPERLIKNVQTQFEITPASPKKRVDADDLCGLLDQKACYRRGSLKLSSNLVRARDQMTDIRRKIAEKVAREREESRQGKLR
jgi:DNA-binding response OmpR family regulator